VSSFRPASSTGDQLVQAAAAGLGLAQTLDFMVRDELRDGRLVRVLAEFESDGPRVHAVTTPERARAPNVQAVVGWLADVLGGLA
jgi:DNA-binding transcriptional LysR family regulator